MVRSRSVALLLAATLAGGCLPTDFLHPDSAPSVPTSPFTTPAPTVAPAFSAKASPSRPEVAIKVDEIGQKLIAANPSVGMKPLFLTIGSPQPEIFHRDTTVVYITEGLIRLCKNEGQLAAVLSMELGRMVSEREALANPETRNPDRRPPIVMTMGNAGQFSGLDQLQQAEVAKLDCDRHRPTKKFVPPDPLVLARGYLEAAGFAKTELDAAAPALQEAERNFILEKQFRGAGSNTPQWAPR